jgi:hypothetical protein
MKSQQSIFALLAFSSLLRSTAIPLLLWLERESLGPDELPANRLSGDMYDNLGLRDGISF